MKENKIFLVTFETFKSTNSEYFIAENWDDLLQKLKKYNYNEEEILSIRYIGKAIS